MTDHILIERVTDGERCGEDCPCKFTNRVDESACILGGQELSAEYAESAGGLIYYRCPSCLSTSSAPALTAEQAEEW